MRNSSRMIPRYVYCEARSTAKPESVNVGGDTNLSPLVLILDVQKYTTFVFFAENVIFHFLA